MSEFYREALAFKQSFNNDLLLADLSRRMLLITRMPYGAALPYLPTVKGHSAAEGVIATGRPAVGDTFLGPVSRERMISVAVPVERQGRVAFLLMSVMETRLFQKRLDEVVVPAGFSLAVLDGKGDLVASRPPVRPGERPSADEIAGRIVIRSAVSPWIVVLAEPRESHHGPILAAAAAMAAAILGATLISFLGGRLAGRRLAHSVASLAQPSSPHPPGSAIREIEAVRAVLLASLSAREEAQLTLRRSEESYRSLVESAPLAIFINRENRIEYTNRAALRLFGVEKFKDLLGKSPFDFVHPDFHAVMTERMRTLFEGGSVALAQTLIVQPGGAERNVEVIAAVFADRQGPAIQVMMQDISERNQAEVALRESEERYRDLVQNANSAIVRWKRDGSITFFNEYAQQHFGYRLDQVIGKQVGVLLLGQEPGAADSKVLVQDVLEQPERYANVDNENLCSDGRRVWMTWTNKPIYDAQGQVQEILAVGSDITQGKLAEQELRRNEQMLRLFMEHAPASLAMFDRNMCYLHASLRWLSDFGLTGRDLRGLSHYVVFPEIGAEWKEIHRRCLAGEVLRSESDCFERADGSQQWLRWEVRPWRDASEAVAGILVFCEDISERKEAERELQEKNAELERFTYMISHDLKSPLVTLKTFLGYLELDLAEANSPRVEKDLQFMKGAAERMGRLLDELLEMSRVGRMVNEPVALSCSAVVHEAVALVAGSLATRGVVVLAELPGLTLFGDQARLVEIWQNLVENACKFMGDQPEPRLELGARGRGRWTIFFVRDNGIGIEHQYLEKVFGLFEKLDRNAEGTGLGLALVQRIVELNGGKIWTQSQGCGLGTCISFTLPGAVRDDWEGSLS